MNSCGVNKPSILNQFTAENPDVLEDDYYFSSWYHAVETICKTPTSFFFTLKDLHNGVVDRQIASMKNAECFARLDSVSAKPTHPYKTAKEILLSFANSDRCRPYTHNNECVLVLREYIHHLPEEFRCFVHEKKFRAISSPISITDSELQQVISTIQRITHNTDYDSYTADFVIMNNKLILIEINSPVWLFATSGEFDLEDSTDYTILLGKYDPDVISYPVIRCKNY